ncbi:MAG: hypothetical protein WAO13_19535 [Pseudolabrys sp.]|jgi:hypothetical protein
MTYDTAQRHPDGTDEQGGLKREEFLLYRLNVGAGFASHRHTHSLKFHQTLQNPVLEWRVLVTLAQFGAMTAKWALLERRSKFVYWRRSMRLIKRHYVRLQN